MIKTKCRSHAAVTNSFQGTDTQEKKNKLKKPQGLADVQSSSCQLAELEALQEPQQTYIFKGIILKCYMMGKELNKKINFP